jgi:hypothetical protein
VPEVEVPKKAPKIQVEASKDKPKSIRTIEQVKIALKQSEALDALIREINGGIVDFYTKQNRKISSSPLKQTAIPVDIKAKAFSHLNEQLQLKKEELSKIITGE